LGETKKLKTMYESEEQMYPEAWRNRINRQLEEIKKMDFPVMSNGWILKENGKAIGIEFGELTATCSQMLSQGANYDVMIKDLFKIQEGVK